MKETFDLNSGFQFDKWKVLPDRNILLGPTGEMHIEPKMMDVLVFLAKNSGEIVDRDTLISNIWKGLVVSDDVLSRIISLLRTSLGDSSRNPKYIQTVPKKGYLFIATISALTTLTEQPLAIPRPPKMKALYAICASVVVVLFIVFLGFNDNSQEKSVTSKNVATQDLSGFTNLDATQTKLSIAVLPFQRETGDVFQQFISEGLFDELIYVLPNIPGVKVVSRKKSFVQLDTVKQVSNRESLSDIDLILDGNISQKSNGMVFTIQLISLKSREIVWSTVYESEQKTQYDIQSSVINLVSAAIQDFRGKAAIKIVRATPPNPEAYQLYIRGRQQFKLRGETALRESIQLLSQAIRLDPNFQKSYISLAEAYSILPFYSAMPARDGYTLALNTLKKLRSDDKIILADALAVKAQIAARQWQWADAEALFLSSFKLSTQNANTYLWYSEFLSAIGRLDDSRKAATYSKELDGISAVVNNRLAVTYLWLDDNVQAEKYFGHGFEFGFINYTNPGYAIFLLRKKEFTAAKETLSLILKSNGVLSDWVAPVIDGIYDDNQRENAVEEFQRAIANNQVPPRFQPPIWIFLTEYRRAANSFDELIQNKYDLDIEFLFSSEAREFRNTEEFQRLMVIIGLEQFWLENPNPNFNTVIEPI
jgi:DNA-binding winged helix-turn-helix (wHTH) protein/TolB-like protein